MYSAPPHGNRKLSVGDRATSYLKVAGPKSQHGLVGKGGCKTEDASKVFSFYRLPVRQKRLLAVLQKWRLHISFSSVCPS